MRVKMQQPMNCADEYCSEQRLNRCNGRQAVDSE